MINKTKRAIRSKRKVVLFLTVLITLVYVVNMTIVANQTVRVHLIKYKYIVDSFIDYYLPDSKDDLAKLDLLKQDDKLSENINDECKMPYISYNNDVSMKYVNEDYKALRSIFDSCDRDEPLTKLNGDNSLRTALFEISQGRIRIKMDHLRLKFNLKPGVDVRCVAQKFDKPMNQSEELLKVEMIGRIYEFDPDYIEIGNEYGFFYVHCVKNGDKSLLFDYLLQIYPQDLSVLMKDRLKYQQDRDKFIQSLDAERRSRMYENHVLESSTAETSTKKKKPMNVLVIGIDSVSSNHFRRVFPLTYDYLKAHLQKSVEFTSFHSMGGNTYPNIVAMLTGIVEEHQTYSAFNMSAEIQSYRDYDSTYHDNLPLIWYDFEKLGYLTYFHEDQADIAIFNYMKKGISSRFLL